MTAADVCDSVVEGKILMKDRKVQTLDEMAILSEARDFMERQEREVC